MLTKEDPMLGGLLTDDTTHIVCYQYTTLFSSVGGFFILHTLNNTMSPQMLGTQFKHQNSIDLTLGTPLDLKFEKLHIRNTQTWVAS